LIVRSYFVGACTGGQAAFSLEDAIDVAGALADTGRSDQAHRRAGRRGDETPLKVDRGQLVPSRKRNEQIAMNH
jgi:hypothetical protein